MLKNIAVNSAAMFLFFQNQKSRNILFESMITYQQRKL